MTASTPITISGGHQQDVVPSPQGAGPQTPSHPTRGKAPPPRMRGIGYGLGILGAGWAVAGYLELEYGSPLRAAACVAITVIMSAAAIALRRVSGDEW